MAALSRGAGTPVVVAQTQSELLPGLDRPTAVLWLGLGLVAANNAGRLVELSGTVTGAHTVTGADSDIITGIPFELGLVGVFWVMARISDSAGSLAVLLLIALWLVWLTTHVANVAKFFGQPLQAPAAIPPVKKPASK